MRLLAVLALAFAPATASQDPSEPIPEYVVKAGFLYNFAKYVEWPEGTFEKADSPIVLGIVCKDPFGADLDKTLKDKTAKGRTFRIQRFATPDKIERCHILFVARTERERFKDIFKKAEGWPVLIVGEDDGFAATGGVVNILIENDKPKLEVNQDAADAAKLVINSKLLRLATLVKTRK